MLSFLSGAAAGLFGTGAPLLFFFSGVYLTLVTGFVQFRRFLPAVGSLFRKQERGSDGALSPRRVLFLGLGAVMGPGNLLGVAAAVAFAGPGAVFWMWFSGAAGMALRYAETFLALLFGREERRPEGMVSVIRKGLRLPFLACFFAFCGVAASLLMADLTSSGAMVFTLRSVYSFPAPAGAALLSLLMLPVLCGGKKRVASFCPFPVAAVSVLFFFLALLVFLRAPGEAASALRAIFSSAFDQKSFAGVFFSPAFREGVKKGVYSNECGMGSEPAFSSASALSDPARQGEISMLGPFLDTVVFCGIAGILCVMSGESDPMKMLPAVFGRFFPGFGAHLVAVFLLLLVYTTLISWYYAGESFALSVFGRRAKLFYRAIYLLMPLLAPLFTAETLYAVCDAAVAMMAFPSLAAILLLSRRVRTLSRQSLCR